VRPPGIAGGSPRPRRRLETALVAMVVGLAVGAGAGYLVASIVLHPSCACPAILVLDLGFTGTGVFHGSSSSFYNFTVTSVANGQPTYGDLAFYFTNDTGQIVPPLMETSWTFVLVDSGSSVPAHFDADNGSWVGFASDPVRAGQLWSINAPGPWLDGGALEVYGTGSYAGWLAAAIP
jgi:hypothetical protein